MADFIVNDAAHKRHFHHHAELIDRLVVVGFVVVVFLCSCTDALGQLIEAPGDRWVAVAPTSIVHDLTKDGTPRARAVVVWVRNAEGRQVVEALGCGRPAGTLAPLGQPRAAKPWHRGGADASSLIAGTICKGHPVADKAGSFEGERHMSDNNTLWIGPDDRLRPGLVGFLVETSNAVRGMRCCTLESLPPHTNQSHQPRLVGWCGSWNDVSICGRGMARVVRLAANGRALVEVLAGDDLRQALEAAGYPELADGAR